MNLQINQIKNRYFNIVENTNIDKTHLWQYFVRIFTILITTYFPLMVIYFFIFISPIYTEQIKSNTIEAMGYTLNLVFITIYYSVLFICQIGAKLKKMINNSNDLAKRKEAIDTGFVVLLTIIGFLLLIFIILSIIYSQVRAYKVGSFNEVSNYILNYMSMMIPILIFNTIANFFVNLSFTMNGIKSIWIMTSLYLIAAIETNLIFIFSRYISSINIMVVILIPSLIISFFKIIIFAYIYFKRSQYFISSRNSYKNLENKHLFLFSKQIYNKLFKRCLFSIWFCVSYTLSITIQSLFIKFAYSIDNKLSYLYTEEGYYILLFVKIIDYCFLYLIFLFSRTLNIAILEHEDHIHENTSVKLARRFFLRKINLTLMSILIIVSLGVYFSLDSLTTKLFQSFKWYNETILDINSYFYNHKYLEIIPLLVKQGYLYGVISFFFVDQSIINRNIISRTDKTNKLVLWIIIIFQFITYSLITYVFAFKLNHIFIGLNGFFVSFGIYGLVALLIIFLFEWIRGWKLYNKNNNIKINKFQFLYKRWKIENDILTKHKILKIEISFYLVNLLIIISIFSWMIFEIIKMSSSI